MSLFFSLIGFIGDLFSSNSEKKSNKNDEYNTTHNSNLLFSKYNYWIDNLHLNSSYSGTFSVRQNDFFQSKKFRRNDGSNVNNYTDLYIKLMLNDYEKLDLIIDEFDRIGIEKKLSDKAFLNMIVSFVQDIPYSLITQIDCNKAYYESDVYKSLIDDGYECDGSEVGGIYSPVEFIKNFKGDCDSRTLFLWTILTLFDYDVIILNSEFYGHSILGVNTPSSGKYKSIYGKRYYTWETTSTGYKLGMLPPDCSNMYYWSLALQSAKNIKN